MESKKDQTYLDKYPVDPENCVLFPDIVVIEITNPTLREIECYSNLSNNITCHD